MSRTQKGPQPLPAPRVFTPATSLPPPAWFRWVNNVLLLDVRVQPRARADELGEPIGDALRIRLRPPPVDGKANARLIALIAETFGVSRRHVAIVAGAHARLKHLRIESPTKLPRSIKRP
ncbi:MAG TPA: YggU family protein [Chromatiaceae bacterium]|jgi:uncharacterized protein (TIGR00251 family)|nr:MAG: DUF167 domain-containing protein [Thiohalocapsa sp. PB-PSB1]HBG95153.1 YggU family protein [Chromatiaceae bacterium]HCS93030.1 YggU family protein [Chromatiaceae bacterium]